MDLSRWTVYDVYITRDRLQLNDSLTVKYYYIYTYVSYRFILPSPWELEFSSAYNLYIQLQHTSRLLRSYSLKRDDGEEWKEQKEKKEHTKKEE